MLTCCNVAKARGRDTNTINNFYTINNFKASFQGGVLSLDLDHSWLGWKCGMVLHVGWMTIWNPQQRDCRWQLFIKFSHHLKQWFNDSILWFPKYFAAETSPVSAATSNMERSHKQCVLCIQRELIIPGRAFHMSTVLFVYCPGAA